MSLNERHERQSLSISVTDDDGHSIMALDGNYGYESISVNVSFIDKQYCSEHKQDVQNVISSFMSRLNVLLDAANLPVISEEAEDTN